MTGINAVPWRAARTSPEVRRVIFSCYTWWDMLIEIIWVVERKKVVMSEMMTTED